MARKLILHEDARSGNCYKIRLTAALLRLPLEVRSYDIIAGETRTREFLETVNATGCIPVLQIDEQFLPESNAACWYLAEGTDLLPEGRFDRADCLRWMFFEQYNHEPNIATLRFWLRFIGTANLSEEQRRMVAGKRAAGLAALQLMEDHLRVNDWLVGEAVTLADIALYPYTHKAEAGGFPLEDFPAVCEWIGRIEKLPAYVPMA